jgi:hypothetical protein
MEADESKTKTTASFVAEEEDDDDAMVLDNNFCLRAP